MQSGQRPMQGRPAPQGQRPYQGRPVSDTRRKATREQMREENRRRRKESLRIFLGRLALYGAVLLILGGICAGIFFAFFYSTPDDNEAKITYSLNYDGDKSVKTEISEELAYPGGVLYLNFSELAEGCGMSVIADSKSAKFVLPDGGDTSDSAGTGHEEYVSFEKDTTECVVCGQDARLTAPAVFSGKDVWVPADFVVNYVDGITVTEEKSSGSVYISRDREGGTTGDENAPLAAVAFKLKATTAPQPAEPDDSIGIDGMPEVTFSTDLSAYEKYMNPADASEYLILVNKTNTVDASHKPDDLTDIANTRQDGRATRQMREYAAKALDAMFIEMKAAGYTDVSVTSSYRSYEEQAGLYSTYTQNEMAANPALTKEQAQAIVDTYSAREGTSEHQTGLCSDLHNLPSADVAFADQPAYDWLSENAWKFGFILRFPEDKTEITGYSFEPWHYRYVGRNVAWQIHSRGICLEEYLAE